MKGIEKLKLLLIFVITFGETLADVLKDKKVTLPEGFTLALNLKPLPATIKNMPEIIEEFKDLDDTERTELTSLVAVELDLPNDKVEQNLELAFSFLIHLTSLIDAFGKKKEGEAVNG